MKILNSGKIATIVRGQLGINFCIYILVSNILVNNCLLYEKRSAFFPFFILAYTLSKTLNQSIETLKHINTTKNWQWHLKKKIYLTIDTGIF